LQAGLNYAIDRLDVEPGTLLHLGPRLLCAVLVTLHESMVRKTREKSVLKYELSEYFLGLQLGQHLQVVLFFGTLLKLQNNQFKLK
jgi:hypothetical protein